MTKTRAERLIFLNSKNLLLLTLIFPSLMKLQAALVIHGLGIRGFDYLRVKNREEQGKFHKFKPTIVVLVFEDPNFSGT